VAGNGVKITGLRELDRALGNYDKDVRKGLRTALAAAAEPVRSQAESLASGVGNIAGGPWSRMRIGVTAKGAYVAPKSRNRGGSPRPNFGNLLMNRAMLPALGEATPEVLTALEAMLDRAANSNGF
jgi:hypothetical protein